jgi:ABC-type lipoprotein export system ATPase subunit
MINKPLVFEKGQHYLIDGESGSGKTSLLYLLKGILKPTELKTTPSIDIINSQTYLTLPNHKSLYSGNLYDIISNYEKTPNTELIDSSLELAKISHILGENKFVNIEKLSGGERIRLLVTRIIYTVKTKNYNILLFDEIDENLNDQIAFEICQNLRSIFSDIATATIIEKASYNQHFIFGTDGSGFTNLMVDYSGFRNRNENTNKKELPNGEMKMNSTEIFRFAIKEVPKLVNSLLHQNHSQIDNIDLFVFHQASFYLLEIIRRKIKAPKEKFCHFSLIFPSALQKISSLFIFDH